MSALLNGIHDRSTVVQKAFAFALGHLVRVSTTSVKQFYYINDHTIVCCSQCVRPGCCICFSHQTAKDSSVEKLLLKLNSWYLEKEGTTEENLQFFFSKSNYFVLYSHLLYFVPPRAGVQVIMCVDCALHQPLQS